MAHNRKRQLVTAMPAAEIRTRLERLFTEEKMRLSARVTGWVENDSFHATSQDAGVFGIAVSGKLDSEGEGTRVSLRFQSSPALVGMFVVAVLADAGLLAYFALNQKPFSLVGMIVAMLLPLPLILLTIFRNMPLLKFLQKFYSALAVSSPGGNP